MKRISKKQMLVWLLALLPVALTALFYARLPENIPMSWGFDGVVSYEPKWQLWIVACMAPLFAVLFPILPKIDPRRRSYDKFGRPYLFFQGMMMVFLTVMVGIVLIESLRPGTLRVSRVVCLLVGLLIALIGNMMPKFRQNYFCGFKTPWTYADEVVWTRTQRLGGRLMFAAGLVGMLAVLIPNEVVMFVVFFVPLICATLIPTVMSFVWYRQRHPE